ncbi:AMP-dependent synthetase and ligase [Streptomyces davaonensis JCM 4913]|uniref:AMP-dependent synthetase and ligase n=1 Tax=Streptomyces davaonensis (strain DSM 101723 / JCM 4913 / KCC S-0913 / 768) TaxID=1214101 RepID=K4R7Y3_STRDJ|nr:AMP-binding protein [Streptomyces davaonensis]CCK32371.1 AMP-dependent synthetase and ligase [Streptomyces davaonensis JCM 4913]
MRPALLSGDTLTACFAAHVRTSPSATVTFPGTDERMTARELDEASLRSARGLMAHGVGPGCVVGLLMPTDATFLSVFFGVQRAGAAVSILPVPAGFGDEAGMARRLARIISTAGFRHLVLDPAFRNVGKLLTDQLPGLVLIDPKATGTGGERTLPATDPDALSVVQFTSGSTSAPKGVQLTQATMAAGLHASVVSGHFSPDDVFMQWVPVFHDMGLIGLVSHLLNGAEVHVFNPIAFLRRPAALLGYFAEHRGTVITGPNFSYDQMLDAAPPELITGLDLSAWRLAFNGAEPVSAATTRRFARALAPAGVGDGVMYPAYGMAEATLAITFPVPGSPVRVLTVDRTALATGRRAVPVAADAPGAKDLVSVGHPVHGIELRLMTEDGRPCAPGESGEIQIAGPPVTHGYLNHPEATAAAFDGRWFRTGDLGLRLDGHLYVTGRRKDMVVVRGQNYFPDDVEAAAQQVPGVYRQRCVAFSDVEDDGREVVRVVVEAVPQADRAELAAQIRARVESEMDFTDVRVHLVKPRWLTRTSSGKWQRALTRERIAEQTGATDSSAHRTPRRTPR